MTKHRDPICGMEVDERTAAAKSEYAGATYYFCTKRCEAIFVSNMKHFLNRLENGAHEQTCGD